MASSTSIFKKLKTSVESWTESGRRAQKNRNFLKAVEDGDSDSVAAFLLDADIDIETKNDAQRPALFLAAMSGHLAVVKQLLDAEANIEGINSKGTTPLGIAALNGQYEVVKELILRGANVNALNRLNVSPLIFASAQGHSQIACLLIKHHALIDVQNDDGNTALMMSAHNGHMEVVRILLQHQADADLENKDDQDAIQLAENNQKWSIVSILKNFGKPNPIRDKLKNYQGEIPEHLLDPITEEVLDEPITLSSGRTINRDTLFQLFEKAGWPDFIECPFTKKQITQKELEFETSYTIKEQVETFVKSIPAAESAPSSPRPS